MRYMPSEACAPKTTTAGQRVTLVDSCRARRKDVLRRWTSVVKCRLRRSAAGRMLRYASRALRA